MIFPPMCYNCKNQSDRDPFKCSAFPGGIPSAIIESRADHRKPIEGDRGILYDPIDPEIPVIVDPEIIKGVV